MRERLLETLNPSGTLRFDIVLFIACFIAYFFASDLQLNDYDAVNYALAVREFNVTLDMPHPPGAPLFVFFCRLLSLIVSDIPTALSLVSAAGGAVFVITWRRIFILLLSPRAAAVGAIILAVSPGVWMTSSQLMSDSLAAAALSLRLLLALYFARSGRSVIYFLFSALLAITVGIRPQYGLLVIVLFFTSLAYFRLSRREMVRAILIFTLANLMWLLPTVYSQYNLDSSGWMTYFNQILRFKTGFDAASGSPLLAECLDAYQVAKRGGTHIGALGYFGLGLNAWYPQSVGAALQKQGTELNPWHADTAEWTYAGTFYTIIYALCFAVLFTRTRHYKQRLKSRSNYLGYLLLFALAYFVFVVMVVPPHIRFYLPIMPFFVLLALMGAQSSLLQNKLQYALLLAAAASALPTLSESLLTKSPPISLIEKIQHISNTAGKGTVLVLNGNASRHAYWYLPDAEVIIKERATEGIDLARIFSADHRVFSNFPSALQKEGVESRQIASYRRSYRVWMRHTSTGLYELKLSPRTKALMAE